MPKYRVLERDGRFYPQKEGMFQWNSFKEANPMGDEYSPLCINFETLDEAYAFLDQQLTKRNMRIHPYPKPERTE